METKKTNVEGKYFNALEYLFNKHGYKKFYSADFNDAVKRFRVNGAFGSFAAKTPLITRTQKGVYQFVQQPTMKHAEKMLELTRSYSKKGDAVPPPPHSYPATGISIEGAIKILKENGYKVMKPITEYQEV